MAYLEPFRHQVLSQLDSEVKGQKPLIEISNVAGVDKNGVFTLGHQ